MPNDSNGRALKPFDLVTVSGLYSVAAVHDNEGYNVDLVPIDPHPSSGVTYPPVRINGGLVTIESAVTEAAADAVAEENHEQEPDAPAGAEPTGQAAPVTTEATQPVAGTEHVEPPA